MRYEDFIFAKRADAPERGFEPPLPFSGRLFAHQRDLVAWAVRRGRAALFAAFGLGKTGMQLEVARQVCAHPGTAGRFLIVAPLGVRQEFEREAAALGVPLRFIRTTAEASELGIYLANYESVRDGKIDPQGFDGVSLDEASCLRGFGSTKTFREFMATMAGDDRRDASQCVVSEGVRYRFVATATPSPNEYIELLAYAAFLGVMEISVAKTRFFKRDSEKADNLTLLPHKEKEFWLWVSTWATFLSKPSDLGYSDDGYELPPLRVVWHEIPTDHVAHAQAGRDKQLALFASTKLGVSQAAREKRMSLDARVAKLMEIRASTPDAHRVIWHDLEAEREAIEEAVPGVVSVFGAQDIEDRMEAILAFADGRTAELAAKPVMLGSGVNFQRHCAEAVFLGIGFKFNDLIQAVHRLYRFQQQREVVVHLVYTEAEREVRGALERRWAQHNTLVAEMTRIVREHGLAHARIAAEAQRASVIHREVVETRDTTLVLNDTVLETRAMETDSVDLIVTSIPFSTQYEYTPHLNDFGHTDTNDHFWRQMDFLLPELLRVLRPGRVAAIHVKDRIVPGGLAGVSFQTVYPFSDECVRRFQQHGFAFLARKTIVTDVVRENAQTYRLGWTEQCKDGSRMGNGMPEYLLIFRKPPTDATNGYADVPVVKAKGEYTRARWQFDAHGFTRSSGNRFLTADDLAGLSHDQIFKVFKHDSLANVYDHERVVQIAEACAEKGMLPSGFMLLQPQSWSDEVWTDVARMRTLNGLQAAKGREQHLCPLQFDIVDRAVTQYTMKGETVFDPFGGLMTVPYCAVKLGRRARAHELNPGYFADGVAHVHAAEREGSVPTLFDLDGAVTVAAPAATSEVPATVKAKRGAKSRAA